MGPLKGHVRVIQFLNRSNAAAGSWNGGLDGGLKRRTHRSIRDEFKDLFFATRLFCRMNFLCAHPYLLFPSRLFFAVLPFSRISFFRVHLSALYGGLFISLWIL